LRPFSLNTFDDYGDATDDKRRYLADTIIDTIDTTKDVQQSERRPGF